MRAMFVMAVTLLMLLPTFASLADEKKLEFTNDTKNSLFLYEREKTLFTVGCNGIGEGKVNVSIERNGTTYAYGITNSEGKVEITLPNVTYSSPFTVKAFKEGYTGDSFTIWILEKPMLYISTQRIVEEEKEFEVKVVDDQGAAVSDAVVTFSGIEGFTDDNGTIEFQAPSVGMPTLLEVYATREKYEPSEVFTLWIADNKTCVIKAPLWVDEGKTFTVTASSDEVSSVTFAGETKEDEDLVFTAPQVNETRAYQIQAYDENGTLLGYRFIVVLNNERKHLLLFGPIETMEDEDVEFHVLSLQTLTGVKGVEVRFAGYGKTTDENGTVVFTSPLVSEPYMSYTAEVVDTEKYVSNNWMVWVKKPEDHSLIINGLDVAYEGDKVTFNVTTGDGLPTFAMVFVGNSTVYTVNGSATLVLPEVTSPCYLTVRAAKPGYLDGYTRIYVKNREKRLNIELEKNSVNEGETFVVKVVDTNNDGVENATVWFNFNSYKTDGSGSVRLVAPDVLLTTNYLIYAEKQGFETDSQWITIKENGVGESFMKLVTPLAVVPWSKFNVKVIDKSGEGLPDVGVDVEYGGSLTKLKTNGIGETTVRAPILTGDSFFTITATKNGYIKDSAVVMLMDKNQLLNDLTVETSSSEVNEGGEMVITVESNGKAVDGANVWVDGSLLPYQTDDAGRVSCCAPYVLVDRPCFIFATKTGYNFGYTWLTVHNEVETMETPVIETKNMVYETESFNVTVTTGVGKPLQGVNVWFNGLQKTTDAKGKTSFTAPAVSTNTYFLLSVNERNFAPAFKLIKVLDKSTSNREAELVISSIPIVLEGENFTVTVKDSYGYLVKDAYVTFNDQIEKKTNEYGMVNFTAPEVSHDSKLRIDAIKLGYSSATSYIEVKNRENSFLEQYWLTVVAIIVVAVVTLFAYLYYRQYMV